MPLYAFDQFEVRAGGRVFAKGNVPLKQFSLDFLTLIFSAP